MKLILIISLLILVGCNRTTNENLLEFNVDRSYDNMGTLISEGELYIWFANRTLDPCVKVFNNKGEEVQTTLLHDAEKILGQITRVWMHHTDSIFAYSYYVNTLVMLDKKGAIIEVNNLDDREDENGNRYEFYPPYGNISPSDHIVFTTFLLKNEYASFHGSWESFSDFCKEMKNGYLLFGTGVSNKTNYSHFGLRLSQLREFPHNDSILFLPLWQTIIANNTPIFTNKYERNIYLLNDDLTIRRIIPVIPDSIEILRPVKLISEATKEEEILFMSKSENQRGSYINHIFYDDNRQIYIMTLLKNDTGTPVNMIRQINVYDSTFAIKKVLIIEDKEKYNGDFCFYMDSMIYIEKTDQQQDEKRIFEAFDV